LRSRRQKKNETIQDLASIIKKLTRKSFPGATQLTVDQEAITYFLQALEDSELRFYVQQSRPDTLQKVVLMTLESQLFLQERRKSMRYSRSIRNDDYNQAFQHLSIDNIEDRLAKIENSTQQQTSQLKIRVTFLAFIVLKMDICTKTVIVETREQLYLIIDIITHRISISTDIIRTDQHLARAITTQCQNQLSIRKTSTGCN
jgi:hypothetical protein